MLLNNILIVLAFLWVQSGAGRVNRQLLNRCYYCTPAHNRGSLCSAPNANPRAIVYFYTEQVFLALMLSRCPLQNEKNWKKSTRNQGIQALTEIASHSSHTNSRNNHHKILNKDNFAALPRNHPSFEKNKKNQHWTCFKVNFNNQISF